MRIDEAEKGSKMINYYYFGIQCPYNYENKKILEQIAIDHDIEVGFYDITKNHELAAKMKLFSPSMIVFDNGLRWSGPITYDLVKRYLEGEIISRKPYVISCQNIIRKGQLAKLNASNISDVSVLCCPRDEVGLKEKENWLTTIMKKYDETFGILHYVENKCVGGAEYLPSLEVPYDVPKSKAYAFLTCLHVSDPIFDYKDHSLKALESHLRDMGYEKIYAVASKDVVFPNGPLEWFLHRGYIDLGLLYYEKHDQAYQHLIVKEL